MAALATAIGFAFDAGSGTHELGSVFAACYVVGSLLAVLAVRQAALFTAIIQPPLLLFIAVPGAYFLMRSSEIKGFKELAINCGYPLIERFPLMFFTSAAVLLLGLVRWYLGMSARRATPTPESASAAPAKKPARRAKKSTGGLLATVSSKLSQATAGASAEPDDEPADEPPRRRSSDRPRRAATPAAERIRDTPRERSGRKPAKPAKRADSASRRRSRAPETEIIEPVVDRPRRTRSSSARTGDTPEPRRRTREAREGRETREPREPRERRAPSADRRSSYDRPERRRRYDDYEPLEPHTNGNGSSHHPVSRVRYRGTDDGDDRADYRSTPRSRRSWDSDRWEYDI